MDVYYMYMYSHNIVSYMYEVSTLPYMTHVACSMYIVWYLQDLLITPLHLCILLHNIFYFHSMIFSEVRCVVYM